MGRVTRAVFVAVASSAFAAPTWGDTHPFSPSKDTEIPSTVTGTACGSIPSQLGDASAVRVGRDAGGKGTVLHRSLFHFDLSIIPTNSTIASAILEFNVAQFTATANFNVEIMRVTQPGWKELETNWDTFDCDADPQRALRWCTGGGDFTATHGVTWTATGAGNQSVDIRSLVEKAVGKTGTKAPTSGQLHFLMKAANDTGGSTRLVLVRSSEYAPFPPRLTVTWTPPSESPNPWVSFRDETAQRLATSSCTEEAPSDPVSDNDRMEKDIAIGDFDQDGDPDVVVVRRHPFLLTNFAGNSSRQPLLFLNEDGVLIERRSRFPTITASARDVVVGDFDGQNGPDIAIVTTCSDPPKFIRNKGGVGASWLGFEDYTANWKPTNGPYDGYTVETSRYCGADARDVDGDGDLDIYMVNYLVSCIEEGGTPTDFLQSNRDVLLINQIDTIGRFFDDTPARLGSNAFVAGFGTSAVIQDTNNDGFVDLIKNDAQLGFGTRIFRSSGPPSYTFTGSPITVEPGVSDAYHIVGGPLNADSSPDLYVGADGADRYYFGPILSNNPASQSVSGPGSRTGSVGGNAKLGDIDGDMDFDVGVADVDQEFTNSCNVCGAASTCSLRCASGTCSPDGASCTQLNHCVEENLNTKYCQGTGFCSDSHLEGVISCSDDTDCQKRLFTLLRNTNGTLDEPWASDNSRNFNLRTYDFEFLDINGDGCLDLFMGVCSGYKVFLRNCS